MRKTKVLYSKFGSQSNAAEMNDVQVVGYINKVKGDHRAQVVSWVSKVRCIRSHSINNKQ